MMSSNTQARNTKHILLNNLGSKQSSNETYPVYVILRYEKNFIGKSYERCDLETSSMSFLIFK